MLLALFRLHTNPVHTPRLRAPRSKGCLLNRHGEDAELAAASGTWVCPPCRGTCGPGCVNCCNCGPCRKRQGLEPTGQLKGASAAAGFGNAHDYLIHLVTGEWRVVIRVRMGGHGAGGRSSRVKRKVAMDQRGRGFARAGGGKDPHTALARGSVDPHRDWRCGYISVA
eukprot:296199-Chlamydomonas_euryale.AAC.5